MWRPTRVQAVAATTGILTAVGTAVFGSLVGLFTETTIQTVIERVDQSPDLGAALFADPFPGRANSVIVPDQPNALAQTGLPNSDEGVLDWAVRRGGAAADSVGFELVVFGTRDYPLVITGLRAKVVESRPAPNWSYFVPEGAGDLFSRAVAFNLDEPDPRGKPVAGEEDPWEFPRQVSQAEAERFTIFANASSRDFKFEVVVVYRNREGTEQEFVVRDRGGKPFRVIGSSQSDYRLAWDSSGTQRAARPAADADESAAEPAPESDPAA